jgi:hypothetical protein
MLCEPPDRRFFSELKDVNAGFLRLLTSHDPACHEPVMGIDAGVVAGLRRLSAAELDYIAGAPGMLAGFTILPLAHAVSESTQPSLPADDRWLESLRLFAAGLMTYIWQLSRRSYSNATFCFGPEDNRLTTVAALSFLEIQSSATQMRFALNARFGSHPRFWPDLIRAATSDNAEFRALARLAIIPLAQVEHSRYTIGV